MSTQQNRLANVVHWLHENEQTSALNAEAKACVGMVKHLSDARELISVVLETGVVSVTPTDQRTIGAWEQTR